VSVETSGERQTLTCRTILLPLLQERQLTSATELAAKSIIGGRFASEFGSVRHTFGILAENRPTVYPGQLALDDDRDTVRPVLGDRSNDLAHGLRVEVGAHPPVGQSDVNHDTRAAVGSDDQRHLGGVENEGRFQRPGVGLCA
jgi:hypothetical protein